MNKKFAHLMDSTLFENTELFLVYLLIIVNYSFAWSFYTVWHVCSVLLIIVPTLHNYCKLETDGDSDEILQWGEYSLLIDE